ncbi:double-strand break repair helicase AddA [Dichotomicrobium thermohalophilum]|uniref:DNA 3'-5' helicase n=1 Tax=Dichotomicrobium thermohalophilum TaxID=933063 RepID=A0A397Q454_9HYPH|nr:double-strand break repair helicase AddA [Dichotomicrobium thermohalophilum]RIA56300.1 DNA helicase/exodeoxyribonuclease V subunit A [Dichotomicrobium thermohalophilum]
MSDSLRRTEAMQARAADPAASAWVRANAGTGKTHVLVQRVLRLLLAGAAPEGIVCLTFTKAAASEMANRLTRALGKWAVAAPDALHARLREVLGRAPSAEETARARRLFAHVLDTPGGLRIQTIHAFCERILRQFPLEAGVAPGFTVLAEEDSRGRMRAAMTAALEAAAVAADGPLERALETVAGLAREDDVEALLGAVLRERVALRQMMRAAEAEGRVLAALIGEALGVPGDSDLQAVAQAQAEVLSNDEIARIRAALAQGGKNDAKLADQLAEAANAARRDARIGAFRAAFLKKSDGLPRADKGFPSNAVIAAAPDAAEVLRAARDRFADLDQTRIALETARASAALFTLADAVIQRYEAGKQADGALDYDDLIDRTVSLLQHGSAWVLYRLDGGIDHLLIDEAQDNSRAQWRVAELLSEEFFAGEGAREAGRSLFAVGDEKQSIYGFQGAAPEHFAALGDAFRRQAEGARHVWHDVPLTRSFRTVAPVLRAVDLVFGGANGLGARIGASAEVAHEVHRDADAGLVEVWPTVKPPERVETHAFAPLDEPMAGAEAVDRLAARIADRIKAWLDTGEILPSAGRPIRAGDILILVRKRQPFAAPMINALKSRGIPVAGADRMRLTEQLAVMDLMALGDALLLPGDDLPLAAVLKSPLIGLSEDDLFALAHEREGSLWEALEDAAGNVPRLAEAETQLARWRDDALTLRPFEFYAAVLDRDGARTRLIARLGPEAADAIDEFLNLALAYEETGPATLQGFLAWLRESGSEVRRDMEQGADQVRVMTVHGAKGLEAPIVFLPDTCTMSTRGGGPVLRVPRDAPGEFGDCLVWAVGEGKRLPAVERVRTDQRAADEAESYRLLYVAMTRARDRLYVTGFESRKKPGRDAGCWYDVVYSALEGVAESVSGEKGEAVLRLKRAGDSLPRPETAEPLAVTTAEPPAWLSAPARAEALAEAVQPSAKEDASQTRHSHCSAEAARRRGELIHLLLERLPEVAPEHREAEAERLVAQRAGGDDTEVDDATRSDAAETALGILAAPEFAHLFGPGSRAEVPIAAQAGTHADDARLSGRIDRLVVHGDDVLVIDYKTDASVPASAESAPPGYIAQLDAYCRALACVFPDKRLRAFILWTSMPALMEIPLDAAGPDGDS